MKRSSDGMSWHLHEKIHHRYVQFVHVGTNATAPVTVDSTNNALDGLAQSSNDQNIGVQASVINDANGSRLALVSQTNGTPGDLTGSSNTTNLPRVWVEQHRKL